MGHDIGIVCIIHDITDMKKMEEKLVKAEKLASIGELAGQIGHDLRNPLAGIKNGIYLIRKKDNQLDRSKEGRDFWMRLRTQLKIQTESSLV